MSEEQDRSEPCKSQRPNEARPTVLLWFESGPIHLASLSGAIEPAAALILTPQESQRLLMMSSLDVLDEGLTMSVYDPLRDSSARPAGSTRFDYAVDDAENPTELTVFSELEDEFPTHWISVDIEHAVALDEMR